MANPSVTLPTGEEREKAFKMAEVEMDYRVDLYTRCVGDVDFSSVFSETNHTSILCAYAVDNNVEKCSSGRDFSMSQLFVLTCFFGGYFTSPKSSSCW